MLTWARQHSDDGDTLNIEGVTVNPENPTTYIWKNLFSKFRKCQRIWSPPITGEIRVKFKFSFFFNIGLMCSTKWIEQELSTCWRGSRYFTLSKQILAFSIIYPLISTLAGGVTWRYWFAFSLAGVRTRSARCIRSDDKTPASDEACGAKITSESRQVKYCPSE